MSVKWMPEIKVPHVLQQVLLMTAFISGILFALFVVCMSIFIFYALCWYGIGWWNLLFTPLAVLAVVLIGYGTAWIHEKWEYN